MLFNRIVATTLGGIVILLAKLAWGRIDYYKKLNNQEHQLKRIRNKDGTEEIEFPRGNFRIQSTANGKADHEQQENTNFVNIRMSNAERMTIDEKEKLKYPQEKFEMLTTENINSDLNDQIEKVDYNEQISKCADITLQYLGHGYCPKSETMRNVTVFKAGESKEINIAGKDYRIPKCFNVNNKNETHFRYLTSDTKENYENMMSLVYGLTLPLKVDMGLSSKGFWKTSGKRQSEVSIDSALYEKRLASIALEDAKQHINENLRDALGKLPKKYNPYTETDFEGFFSKWGTHYICKVWIGGSIQETSSTSTSKAVSEGVASSSFKSRFFLSHMECISDVNLASKSSKFESFKNNEFRFNGGNSIPLQRFNANTLFEWSQNVASNHVELDRSLVLDAYYNLVDDKDRSNSLREATRKKLKREIFGKPKISMFRRIGNRIF